MIDQEHDERQNTSTTLVISIPPNRKNVSNFLIAFQTYGTQNETSVTVTNSDGKEVYNNKDNISNEPMANDVIHLTYEEGKTYTITVNSVNNKATVPANVDIHYEYQIPAP